MGEDLLHILRKLADGVRGPQVHELIDQLADADVSRETPDAGELADPGADPAPAADRHPSPALKSTK